MNTQNSTTTLQIVTIDENEKLLREKSKPVTVEKIESQETQTLISQMTEYLEQTGNGVGLSAVQIGTPLRIFLVKLHNTDTKEIHVFINPEVEKKGTVLEIQEEGCLSIPDIYKPVKRHKRVKVRYLDERGEPQKKTFTGFTARIIQHENDHLDGILFIDKTEN